MKSERLKKLEAELADLQQWMKLGLVPKKEIERHKEEISLLQEKIGEEKERLAFLKESGDVEEYTTPKRGPTKPVYSETPSMSEIGMGDEDRNLTENETEVGNETIEGDAPSVSQEDKEEEVEEEEEDEDDPFSDQNRWRRGGIIDPDATDW